MPRGGRDSVAGIRAASWRSSRLKPAVDDFGFVSKGQFDRRRLSMMGGFELRNQGTDSDQGIIGLVSVTTPWHLSIESVIDVFVKALGRKEPREVRSLPEMRVVDYHSSPLGHRYYTRIVEKYIKFCGSADGSSDLDSKLAAVLASLTLPGKNARFADSSNSELSSILLSMRKLREGIVASKRVDAFTHQVYVFVIRAAILMKHTESYHPALLHLLNTIHPVIPLSSGELQEFAGYYMLHLACQMENYSEAFMVQREFGVKDYRITQAIIALVHGNYWSFRAMKRKVDLYKGRLLEDAENRMRKDTLKCLGKTYFTLELEYVETVMGMQWVDLKKEYQVGWELDGVGEIVTLRRVKKTAPPVVRQKEFKAWEDD